MPVEASMAKRLPGLPLLVKSYAMEVPWSASVPRAVTPTVALSEAFSATVLVAELLSVTERALSSISVTLMVMSFVVVDVSPLESVEVARTVTVWD